MPEIIHHRLSIIHRRGVALLAVLFIIMVITVLSLGFLARSDTESACGQNVALHVQMDQLAASGLEHARGLILNPQEVTAEYWTGAAGQQLASSTHDFYDVIVVADPNDHCNYTITSNAYRKNGQTKVGQSALSAQLRLDPAIALWTGAATTITSGLTVYGDVRCGGSLSNYGAIHGDVFATALPVPGTKTGQLNPQTLSLAWPSIAVADFTSHYTTLSLSGSLSGGTYGPPASVYHCIGDLTLGSNVTFNAMLLVEGNLRIQGNGNVITAPKNLPALYVTGDLVIENVSGLQIKGLAVVAERVLLGAGATGVDLRGGLFVENKTMTEIAVDSSGNGNDGFFYGAPTREPSSGKIGGALQFDGVDDYVRTADSSDKLQLSDDYALSVWMKADSVQRGWAGILCKCDSSGSSYHWGLQFNNSTPRELIAHSFWSFSWSTGIHVADLSGGWHHVCVVHDGVHMRSYVDAGLVKDEVWGWPPGWGTGHLNIGTNRTAQYMYKGLLDDVRIYDQALNSDQVLALKSTGTLPSPIAYWRFDESVAQMTITADPVKAALLTWPGGSRTNWSPAAGAFFKRISQTTP